MSGTLDTSRLAVCEQIIARGLTTFVEVGEALLEIRDSRLYRETHATFEAYCRERWGWGRQEAYDKISAAQVVKLLSPIGDNAQHWPVPANEAQARELAPLRDDPEALRDVWSTVAQSPVTATAIRREVTRRTAGQDESRGRAGYIALLEVLAGFHGFVGTYTPEAVADDVEDHDRERVALELDEVIKRIAALRDALRSETRGGGFETERRTAALRSSGSV